MEDNPHGDYMNRRMRLRLVAAVLVAVAAGLWAGSAIAADQPDGRPNIVLIIADDLGCRDSGPYGSTAVRTPTLDRLAREGLRFDRAFNTCSSCSPSRSSIITGRYPHSTGAERLHMPLPGDQVTFVEKLKAAGYWTAQAGKWHLGPAVKNRFDVVNEGGVKGGDGSGCERWIATIRQRPADKPFFLWLASFDPHRPYREGTIPQPHKPANAWVPPYLPAVAPTRKDLAMYYDEAARLDSYVAKVLDELQRQGVLERTAVFFITDNGRPFPRCKTTVYDSGVQTPLLVRWPGKVKAGTTCGALVSTVDLAPTFLDLAGVEGGRETFQGQSFARLLSDPSAAGRKYVFAEHNWHDYMACERGVRDERYKYIRNYWPDLPGTPPADAVSSMTFQEMRRLRDAGQLTGDQMSVFVAPRPAEELYDTQADPHELKNLAGEPALADKLKELGAALEEWRKETKDFVPSPRPADQFDRETGKRLAKPK
ncbi:MAG: Arylsulfatase [Planctomycetes bacterium ADurb.Bin126]|nr:MAG: Arylsulfatase [Planctomycetes bacterium ADurb.Bin126]